MPVTYSFKDRIVCVHPEGTYAAEDMMAALDRAVADPKLPHDPRVLLDVTRSESLADRPVDDLRRIVDHYRVHTPQLGKRCAVIVASQIQFGLMRMASAWGETLGLEIGVFKSEAEATEWLERDRVGDRA